MYDGQFAFSNREDWVFDPMEIVDDDTDELIDLSSALITFGLYDKFGCAVVSGSTDTGLVVLVGTTAFQIIVPKGQTGNFCGTYHAGLTIENGAFTKQFIIGSVGVLQGWVP